MQLQYERVVVNHQNPYCESISHECPRHTIFQVNFNIVLKMCQFSPSMEIILYGVASYALQMDTLPELSKLSHEQKDELIRLLWPRALPRRGRVDSSVHA